ncbi:MAG: pantoate--beta-alanine ligase, partial [Chloroflexota bacterium]|nr:pantoate--beta-alanine ligase [Chloroflexota bacterium]
ALSSRNVYLSPKERTQAVALYRALIAAREAVDAGERRVATLEGCMRREMAKIAPLARLDYASLVDAHTLQPMGDEVRGEAMASIALYLGSIRLIDNEIIQVPAARSEEGEHGATDHT